MKYRFERERRDYSAFASGAVLYSRPGTSAFPIRLASEVFQYCYDHLRRTGAGGERITVFDPCCGSAYHLAALGFLHPDKIGRIICSDIDERILEIARKNLRLLSSTGIDQRISELDDLFVKYRKESHQQAGENARWLKTSLGDARITTECHRDDIFNDRAFDAIQNETIDIVFADVPYGNLAEWRANRTGKDGVWVLLDRLRKIAGARTIVVVATNKRQTLAHDGFSRIEQMKTSKRKISILQSI